MRKAYGRLRDREKERWREVKCEVFLLEQLFVAHRAGEEGPDTSRCGS